ncbi:hypothetical protein LTR36_000903 [Oleoguttula mirabilis]|uniref:Uncharacterized protein n=1 Tax=Oleoguttula mirabilis TaxID=1507867 RepID=A0AAV9JPF0_9PEZI|nr:hypothetical protein LTR36_000903 [Oleoguttula mirabilis]
MKVTTILPALLGFTAIFAAAAPVDDVRRDVVRRARQERAAIPAFAEHAYAYAYPSGSHPTGSYPTASAGYPVPSGVQPPYPTGTTPAYTPGPMSTGTTCSPNGALICHGLYQFGLCNWGQVVWQDVAEGTACYDGQIDFAPGYPQ